MSALVGVIDCNISNLTSVLNAHAALGIATRVIQKPDEMVGCSHLLLPGVGSFARAAVNIRHEGLNEAIVERARAGTPLLGVCLGMQLLADTGTEFGANPGLGLIPGIIERIPTGADGPRLPHIGWNDLTQVKPCAILAGVKELTFYFVHSFAFSDAHAPDVAAITEYGGQVVAIVARDNISGVQFHPEKSQKSGLAVLKNFAAC
jgi:glutamine amidotransferase